MDEMRSGRSHTDALRPYGEIGALREPLVSPIREMMEDEFGSPHSVQAPDADALMDAWGVIANVSGGDWTQQSPEWQAAAARWRDTHLHGERA